MLEREMGMVEREREREEGNSEFEERGKGGKRQRNTGTGRGWNRRKDEKGHGFLGEKTVKDSVGTNPT